MQFFPVSSHKSVSFYKNTAKVAILTNRMPHRLTRYGKTELMSSGHGWATCVLSFSLGLGKLNAVPIDFGCLQGTLRVKKQLKRVTKILLNVIASGNYPNPPLTHSLKRHFDDVFIAFPADTKIFYKYF